MKPPKPTKRSTTTAARIQWTMHYNHPQKNNDNNNGKRATAVNRHHYLPGAPMHNQNIAPPLARHGNRVSPSTFCDRAYTRHVIHIHTYTRTPAAAPSREPGVHDERTRKPTEPAPHTSSPPPARSSEAHPRRPCTKTSPNDDGDISRESLNYKQGQTLAITAR